MYVFFEWMESWINVTIHSNYYRILEKLPAENIHISMNFTLNEMILQKIQSFVT